MVYIMYMYVNKCWACLVGNKLYRKLMYCHLLLILANCCSVLVEAVRFPTVFKGLWKYSIVFTGAVCGKWTVQQRSFKVCGFWLMLWNWLASDFLTLRITSWRVSYFGCLILCIDYNHETEQYFWHLNCQVKDVHALNGMNQSCKA